MRKSLHLSTTLFATLMLAGCSGGGAADSSGPSGDASGTAESRAGAAAQHSSGRAAPVALADVEFAYRCRGVLAAASASARILPAGEAPPELAQIDMKAIAWWTGEASRRDDAAGISKEQRAQFLSGTVRVLATREKIEEALPTIRECLAQMPT